MTETTKHWVSLLRLLLSVKNMADEKAVQALSTLSRALSGPVRSDTEYATS